MRLLIWGVSNVGKTTIGRELSKILNCKFYDVDDEIVKVYGSIDSFQEKYQNDFDRYNKKKHLMMNIIESDDNFIMAVSPIYSSLIVEELLKTNTFSVEITDTVESIYNRLIIDGDDWLEYKEKNKNYYMREIWIDQFASFDEFKNIPKISIDNQSINEAIKTVNDYLKNIQL